LAATAWQDEQRIDSLDGLRGFAVLAVIVCHLFPELDQPDHWLGRIYNGVIEAGWSGVDLFFVLSGFLITGILVRNRQSANYFRSFYARRILRIFPLYYILCIIVIFILPAMPFPASWDLHRQPGNPLYYFLFFNNFSAWLEVPAYKFLSVCWSLAIEEQFYLVWPFLLWWLSRDKALYACIGVFVGTIALRNFLFLAQEVPAETVFRMTFTHLDGIAIGSITALALSDRLRYERLTRMLRQQGWLTGPLLLGVFLYCAINPGESRHLSYHPVMVSVGYPLFALVFCCLLLHCVLGESWVTHVLRSPAMRRVGKYSYAMYLLHFPASSLTKLALHSAGLLEATSRTPLPFFLSLVLTYALAALSWQLLESRFSALKKRFPF
jgi:peptidoglycan/LPS O-acetylase OafA/YrhL